MTSQPGKRTNVVHILLNISRRKDNETLKFGQLIECNIRNVFLEKSYTKCGRKTISRLFSKKNQNWAYLWINGLKLYTVYFYFMPSQGLSKDITSYNFIYLILPHIYTSSFISQKTFFRHNIWRKIFLLLYSINWPNFTVWLPLLRKILDNRLVLIVVILLLKKRFWHRCFLVNFTKFLRTPFLTEHLWLLLLTDALLGTRGIHVVSVFTNLRIKIRINR